MKKGIKVFLIMIILLYLGLYFTYKNGYYEQRNQERKVLTEEMIQEYEEDLKNGVDVTNKEYVVVRPNYGNIYTNETLKISKKIEKGFDQIIKYFFNKLSKSINE